MQCERFTSCFSGLFNQNSGKAGCDRGPRLVNRTFGSDLPVGFGDLFSLAALGVIGRGARPGARLLDRSSSGRRCGRSRRLERHYILSIGVRAARICLCYGRRG